MSYQVGESDPQFIGYIDCPDGLSRSYRTEQEKTQIERMNELLLSLRERNDAEFAQKVQAAEYRDYRAIHLKRARRKPKLYINVPPIGFTPGSNNAHSPDGRMTDPWDRKFRGAD